MKQLTQSAIHLAAMMLMEASPISQTTSLEVKNLLRFLGYEAYQSQISNEMPLVAAVNGWFTSVAEEDGKEFRVYSRESLETEEDDSDEENEQVEIDFTFRA